MGWFNKKTDNISITITLDKKKDIVKTEVDAPAGEEKNLLKLVDMVLLNVVKDFLLEAVLIKFPNLKLEIAERLKILEFENKVYSDYVGLTQKYSDDSPVINPQKLFTQAESFLKNEQTL